MNKSAIFITFDGLTDPLGQSQILPYVVGIAKSGFRMHIISCEKEKRISRDEKLVRKLLEAENVTWDFLVYREEGGFVSRLRYIAKLKSKTGEAIRQLHPALIHCRSYLAALVGLHFKRRMNIAFVFDMRGLWADERIDGGIWKKSNPLQLLMYRYFKYRERAFVKYADAIVSLTDRGRTELQQLFPALNPAEKTVVIPCCTDTRLFDPSRTEPASLPGLESNATLLVYSGSVGTWYCTSEMIDCALSWRKKIPALQLLILSQDQTQLDEVLREKKLPAGFLLRTSCSREQVPAYLRLASAAIFFIRPVYSKLASSPTKMAECWSMDLPVITNSGIGDNDALFRVHKGGVLVNAFSEAGYLEALHEFLALENKKGPYRNIALQGFDLGSAVESYRNIYTRITKKHEKSEAWHS